METKKEYIEVTTIINILEETSGDMFDNFDGDYYAESGFSRNALREIITTVPKADVAEVAHAKWKLDRYATEWTCSNCEGEMLYQVTTYGGGQYHDLDNIFPPYCPHCGARMDLED